MGCGNKVQTTTTIERLVFSVGGSTNQGESAVFVMSHDSLTQLAPSLASVRVSAITSNLSENAEVSVVIQTTEDGATWVDTQTQLVPATWISSNATTTYDWWNAVSQLKRGIRVGVRARQTTGTSIEMGVVQLVIDWELK